MWFGCCVGIDSIGCIDGMRVLRNIHTRLDCNLSAMGMEIQYDKLRPNRRAYSAMCSRYVKTLMMVTSDWDWSERGQRAIGYRTVAGLQRQGFRSSG